MYILFFNDTATTEIYTLSLHDALPIWAAGEEAANAGWGGGEWAVAEADESDASFLELGPEIAIVNNVEMDHHSDRKSTRLNSSHANISYAVFCLKKKKNSHYTSLKVSI